MYDSPRGTAVTFLVDTDQTAADNWDAIRAAPEGCGVLILADGYPEQTTVVEPAAFDEAARKKLRLYVEYPGSLPDIELGQPQIADNRGPVNCIDLAVEVMDFDLFFLQIIGQFFGHALG